MKREIPLFLIDTKKTHKKGECDFLVCTDRDNSFVARLDYIAAQEPCFGDDFRIDFNRNGLSLKLTILRITGLNPSTSAIRTLMKKGIEYYTDSATLSVDATNATTRECINFIESLTAGNRHYLEEAGINHEERTTILTSLMMLDAVRNKLYKLELTE